VLQVDCNDVASLKNQGKLTQDKAASGFPDRAQAIMPPDKLCMFSKPLAAMKAHAWAERAPELQ
jgi:hypothetical protein